MGRCLGCWWRGWQRYGRRSYRLTLQLPTSRLYATDVRSTDSVSLRAQLGAPSGELLAYIPDLGSYARNQKTMLIANSVGGFRNNGRANYLTSHASFVSISCRDQMSYEAVRELQSRNGVSHRIWCTACLMTFL